MGSGLYKGASMGACEVSPKWRKKQRKKREREQKALDERQKLLSGEVRTGRIDPDALK